jgi:hypothetical protein
MISKEEWKKRNNELLENTAKDRYELDPIPSILSRLNFDDHIMVRYHKRTIDPVKLIPGGWFYDYRPDKVPEKSKDIHRGLIYLCPLDMSARIERSSRRDRSQKNGSMSFSIEISGIVKIYVKKETYERVMNTPIIEKPIEKPKKEKLLESFGINNTIEKPKKKKKLLESFNI